MANYGENCTMSFVLYLHVIFICQLKTIDVLCLNRRIWAFSTFCVKKEGEKSENTVRLKFKLGGPESLLAELTGHQGVVFKKLPSLAKTIKPLAARLPECPGLVNDIKCIYM
jgi:hypothetical protein